MIRSRMCYLICMYIWRMFSANVRNYIPRSNRYILHIPLMLRLQSPEEMETEMYYTVQHVTRFRYSAPISESIMEVRIQPRSEGIQRSLDFRLHTNPRAHIMNYRGGYGNRVHHFDVPNRHSQLTITAQALVELTAPPPL